jgi:hypothetical protein
MGSFTWSRIAGLAGLGLAAAGTAYFLKTEKGKKLVQQAREKGRELWLKAREEAASATEGLEASTQPSLTPGDPVEEPAT